MLKLLALFSAIVASSIKDVQGACSLNIDGNSIQWLDSSPDSYGNNCLQLRPTIAIAWKKQTVNNVEKMVFEVHAKTPGWVGVGISTANSMLGADVDIFWISGTASYIYDCKNHDSQRIRPTRDTLAGGGFNNVDMLNGKEVNGITSVQYTRPWVKSDVFDHAITKGKQWLIWAYGDQDPNGNNFNNLQKHTTYGTNYVTLGSSRMGSPAILTLLLMALTTVIINKI